jgi:hypothetical protein
MRYELYDLVADLGEQHDLGDLRPRELEELRTDLVVWLRSAGARVPVPRRNG